MKNWLLLTSLMLATPSCSPGDLEIRVGIWDAKDGAGGAAAEGVVALGPLPYREFADSPFAGLTKTDYFYVEDFEDHELNTPGVTGQFGVLSSSYGLPKLVDSVDGDDQDATNDACIECDAYFNMDGPQGVGFAFDATVLNQLPTHVGIVYTDATPPAAATFTAFDENDNELVTITGADIADDTNATSCLEDRFFGVIAPQGVRRILFITTNGGIEADHLQYGILTD